MDGPAHDIESLQRCIEDLLGIHALSTSGTERSPQGIAAAALQALLDVQHLEFAYLRLSGPPRVRQMELVLVSPQTSHRPADDVAAAVRALLGAGDEPLPSRMASPLGAGEVSIAHVRLNGPNEAGVLVAGARRAEYPTELEHLVLRVAADHLVSGVREARLAVANDDLRAQIATLRREMIRRGLGEGRQGEPSLARSAAQLAGLAEAAIAVHAARSIGEIVETIVGWARAIVGARIVDISMRIDDDAVLYAMAAAADRPLRMTAAQLDAHPAWRQHREAGRPQPPLQGLLAACLVATDGRTLGLLYLSDKHDGEFTADDESIAVQLAHMASVAIEKAGLHESLKKSEAYLAEGQRLTHTGSWAWNVSTNAVFWSDEHFRILGLDPERVRPSRGLFWSLVHPADRPGTLAAFERAVRERRHVEADHRVALADGTVKHIHSVAHPVLDTAGGLIEYVGTIVDTTERIRAEQKVRESEARLRLLTDAIPQHVWTYGPDGFVAFVNQRWLEYTGLTLADAQHGGWVQCLHPDDAPAHLSAWREALAHGTTFESAIRYRRVDGEYRRFLARSLPLRDERGVVVEWVGTNTDIEDRERAQEALHEAQAELAHVNRQVTMGALATSLAHELNQPLAAIVTHASAALSWLNHDPPNLGQATTAIQGTIRDANRASDIITSTRAFLRKTAAKQRLDAAELVREVLGLVELEAAKHRVVIHEALADRLPPILGVRSELQQVLLNLIMNAFEAMAEVSDRPREITIRCREHMLAQGLGVFVAVEDAGIGIPPEDGERLFAAFHTTKASGLGMGLSIARAIVEAHGGRLWASSNRDHGATFQFVLPAAPPT
jgi:PAS domain S-box-containing protein